MTNTSGRVAGANAAGRKTALAVAAAATLALTGCQTLQEGLESFQSGVVDATIDYHIQPTVIAMAEEYCVAMDIVLEQTGLLKSGYGGPFMEAALTELMRAALEDDVPAMYCTLNVVSAAAVTERALNMMVAEIGRGFVAAYDGLEMKDEDVLQTLLAVQQLEAEGSGASAGDSVVVTIRQLDEVSAALKARIDERIEAGGLSQEAKDKLVQAAGHLRNASYYRGKALVGAWVIYRELSRGGIEALVVDALQAAGHGDDLTSMKVVMTGGLTLARGTGDSLALTGRLRDLADREEFDVALEELKNPDPAGEDSLATYAKQEEQQAADLGLPTLEETPSAS